MTDLGRGRFDVLEEPGKNRILYHPVYSDRVPDVFRHSLAQFRQCHRIPHAHLAGSQRSAALRNGVVREMGVERAEHLPSSAQNPHFCTWVCFLFVRHKNPLGIINYEKFIFYFSSLVYPGN